MANGRRDKDNRERKVDDAIEESFPANNAPATGGTTRVEKEGRGNTSHVEDYRSGGSKPANHSR